MFTKRCLHCNMASHQRRSANHRHWVTPLMTIWAVCTVYRHAVHRRLFFRRDSSSLYPVRCSLCCRFVILCTRCLRQFSLAVFFGGILWWYSSPTLLGQQARRKHTPVVVRCTAYDTVPQRSSLFETEGTNHRAEAYKR